MVAIDVQSDCSFVIHFNKKQVFFGHGWYSFACIDWRMDHLAGCSGNDSTSGIMLVMDILLCQ